MLLCLRHSRPPAAAFVAFGLALISQAKRDKSATICTSGKRSEERQVFPNVRAWPVCCVCMHVRLAGSFMLPPPPLLVPSHFFFFFSRLDFASRQMVPVCWLFFHHPPTPPRHSIHFLSSHRQPTHPPLPSLTHTPPLSSRPPPLPTPSSNGSSVMWVEIIFYCPVVRK